MLIHRESEKTKTTSELTMLKTSISDSTNEVGISKYFKLAPKGNSSKQSLKKCSKNDSDAESNRNSDLDTSVFI
ncbi:hypothetical protein QYF36_002749 [Acer negundo]|nr:hypothetical protein QYF36_002749 [Acer negundo]